MLKQLKCIPMSLPQLPGTLHNLCRGRGLNSRHSTSPHLNVQTLITRFLDKKRKKKSKMCKFLLEK